MTRTKCFFGPHLVCVVGPTKSSRKHVSLRTCFWVLPLLVSVDQCVGPEREEPFTEAGTRLWGLNSVDGRLDSQLCAFE